MQSKSSVNAVPPLGSSRPEASGSGESDKAYLDKNGVPDLMRTLLGKMVERQPSEPFAFITEFFQSIDSRCLTIEEAERHLLLTDYRSPLFRLHLKSAYDVMVQLNKSKRSSGLMGVVGDDVNKLIQILLKDTPKREMLVPKLKLKPFAWVAFDVLRALVITCLVYKDFMTSAKHLFVDIKELSDGKPNETIVKTVLNELYRMIREESSDKPDTFNSGPQSLKAALVRIPAKKYTSPDCISEDQFLSDAAHLFVDEVKVFR